jgi:dephospho-CoA kinase
MATQWPDSRKIKAADYVIDNSGSLDSAERQVRELYQTLKDEAVSKAAGNTSENPRARSQA